MQRALGIGV